MNTLANGLVSIIIPTYNRAKMLPDAIESIVAQTYTNTEIIVIDDGSTDDTEAVIKSYGEKVNIKYLKQKNLGPAAARNNGIKHSSGKYIAFLDSDDLWHSEKLKKQVKILDKNPEIAFVSCFSRYITYNNKELFVKKCIAQTSYEYLKYLLLSPDEAFSGTPTIVTRKEFAQDNFDEKFKYCEDWDFVFRLCLKGEFYCVPEVLTFVRRQGADEYNIEKILEFRQANLNFLNKVFSTYPIPSSLKKLEKISFSNFYQTSGFMSLVYDNNAKSALNNFISSIKYNKLKFFDSKFMTHFLICFLPKNLRKKLISFKRKGKS